MADTSKELLLKRRETLRGADIEVSETGFWAQGIVDEVTVDEDGFSITYTGKTGKSYCFGGAWGHASAYTSGAEDMYITVPMVGSAVIRP